MQQRVGIIGCGPCGMSTLYHFGKISDAKRPDIVCYEKQATWGGLWNYSWRTGRMNSSNTDYSKYIRFSTVVRRVDYRIDTDDFTVLAKNLITDQEDLERFSHVIVATGIFNTPNIPSFTGIDTFPGRIQHSHDFRDAKEYKDQKILVIGASYSAEDLALQTLEFGAKKITTCWRSKPMGFKWPTGIDKCPVVVRFEGKTAHFRDGSLDEFDAVLLCTGYKKHYPFLPDDLRLTGRLTVYPPNLYKGTVWIQGGNGKLLYLCTQDQYYTYSIFDVQALWACHYITGMFKLPTHDEMLKHLEKWRKREATLNDFHNQIDMQSYFILDLCKDVPYDKNIA